MNKRTSGSFFEDIAYKYLLKHHYLILDRNYFCGKYGELDMVCRYKDKIVFVEVKGRQNPTYGPGENSITTTKKKHLILASRMWIHKHKSYDIDWQIDVIAIDLIDGYISSPKVIKLRHYKNCITQNDYK